MPRARNHRIGLVAGGAPAAGTAPFQEDEFTATGGQTVFVLSETFALNGMATVTVNGVRYAQGTNYTISGTTLTWLDTPFTLEVGDCIIALYEFVP
jgi:hypothetical protein